MTRFAVWAPPATKVELQLGERLLAMSPEMEGWWAVEVPDLPAGVDYAFRLDGGQPLPDPRSPWQPQGVHGPSRTVDHAAFKWTDRFHQSPPLSSAVIYELHVGTFTPEGTFAAAAGRLDHLLDLGVTHIELMPVVETPGRWNWGYDGVDLFAPSSVYGGPDGLKQLIDAAHARHLGIIIDVVYNHLGPEGNYLARFGPYFTRKHNTPWGQAVNFDDRGCDPVRRFVIENALMWLRDYHADGLRIDAVHAILDTSVRHILEEIAEEVAMLRAQTGRGAFLIGESDLNDPRIVLPAEVGGYGLDAQWSDDFHHALHCLLTGEREGYYVDYGLMSDLIKSLQGSFVYDGRFSQYRGRRHGRRPLGIPGSRFLAYLQNHDQVGNRARGERISELVSPGKLKIGSALVFTSPFVPLVFAGEEWAASTPFLFFSDCADPDLRQKIAEGRRREFEAFGWRPEDVPDPTAESSFLKSKLKWDELAAAPHAAILDWYRRLIRLRRTTPELLDGRLDRVSAIGGADAGWLLVHRGPIAVACNFTDRPVRVPLFAKDQTAATGLTILLASDENIRFDKDGTTLPPESVVIARS